VEFLLANQNSDGGWGYFPGRSSWMEPTFYAMLALSGTEHKSRTDKTWKLIRSWQLADGGCRPNGEVRQANWCTALWVTLHCARGVFDGSFQAGVKWLLDARGAEGALWRRAIQRFRTQEEGSNGDHYGWSWFPDSNSWVEPTVHTVVAMKSVLAAGQAVSGLSDRIALGQAMLMDRRCADGGWNYGSRMALDVELPSYPETTGIGLLGMQGADRKPLEKSYARARAMWDEGQSPMGRAWIELALRVHGRSVPDAVPLDPPGGDLLLAAVQILAGKPGPLQVSRTGKS
jgi:hypothetical protein